MLHESLSKKHLAASRLQDSNSAQGQRLSLDGSSAILSPMFDAHWQPDGSSIQASKAVFQELGRDQHGHETKADTVPSSSTRRSVVLERRDFEERVFQAIRGLTDKSAGETDIRIACRVREQRACVIILLAGTSGTGKSTLAGLLAAKMGITTVVSTDSIRHMLRSFISEAQDPILWASTYQAGELIPQLPTSPCTTANPRLDAKVRAVQGYKAQCEPVVERIARLVASCEARRESMVVEGVHLSINSMMRIMAQHPCVVPFLIHISNENKHQERFAVRAKYMTLDPVVNRYVKHLRQIRIIQDYLVKRAERHCIPCVDNTNVDRSVAAIHATILSCLRRKQRGETILDVATKTASALADDYELYMRDAWSSKTMLELIRSRKSAAGDAAAAAAVAAVDGLNERTEVDVRDQQSIFGAQPPKAEEVALMFESSDGGVLRVDAASSGEVEGCSATEPRVEGGSVVETEIEEPDEDDPSEALWTGKRESCVAASGGPGC